MYETTVTTPSDPSWPVDTSHNPVPFLRIMETAIFMQKSIPALTMQIPMDVNQLALATARTRKVIN